MSNIHPMPQPGDPRYIDIDEMVRRELARRADYEALPSTIEKLRIEAEVAAWRAAERNAAREHVKQPLST